MATPPTAATGSMEETHTGSVPFDDPGAVRMYEGT